MAALAAAIMLIGGGCKQEIDVPQAERRGAELFKERCSGCHTFEAAASQGSSPEGEVKYVERTNGPNFDVKKEEAGDVLFAIRHGGFSGAIMPANIVVGKDAAEVSKFVCMYAGQKEPRPASECELSQAEIEGKAAPSSAAAKPSTGNAPAAGAPEGEGPTPGQGKGARHP
jgi:hypothetical protein